MRYPWEQIGKDSNLPWWERAEIRRRGLDRAEFQLALLKEDFEYRILWDSHSPRVGAACAVVDKIERKVGADRIDFYYRAYFREYFCQGKANSILKGGDYYDDFRAAWGEIRTFLATLHKRFGVITDFYNTPIPKAELLDILDPSVTCPQNMYHFLS